MGVELLRDAAPAHHNNRVALQAIEIAGLMDAEGQGVAEVATLYSQEQIARAKDFLLNLGDDLTKKDRR